MNDTRTTQWIAHPQANHWHTLGSTLYVATPTSRRLEKVIGSKPGMILILFQK